MSGLGKSREVQAGALSYVTEKGEAVLCDPRRKSQEPFGEFTGKAPSSF